MLNSTACTRMLLAALAALALTLAPAPAEGALAPANEHGQFRYLIEFFEPGALHALDREPGKRFDPDSDQAQAYMAHLEAQHTVFLQEVSAGLARVPQVTHRYLVTHSGMAAWLTPDEAEIVRALPKVESVQREWIESVHTFRGPTFIGAHLVWDGTAVPDGDGTRGEGMVAGVLDTGIDPDHPAFANDAACGHGDGGVSDKLLSFVDCATTDAQGRCNGPLPLDTNGHGTHVISTVAGNRLDESTDPSPEPFGEISGVAPCAHIRSYKVCPEACPAAQIQAGMNTILLDGDVDVMNFSISGGGNPWGDNDRRKLDLVDAGVLVAAAAGNTGPTIPDPVGQVNHLGPWVFTVAASTHDGGDLPHLSASGPGTPPDNTQLLVMTRPSADVGAVPESDPFIDKPIRRAVDDLLQVNDEGCTPYSAGYFSGAVALIQRGTCQFAIKVQNAEAAGAEVIIIRNNEPGALVGWTVGVATDVPVYGMSMSDGENLAAWIGQHPDSTTANLEFLGDPDQGDVLAGFSLRGPTPAPLQHLQKPDITAPGVSIFAAEPTLFGLQPGYGFKSGTSMASPHAAGAALLMRAVRPGWTPSEVKSALMMTSFQGGTKENMSTPWDADDVGSGRVDLTGAALSGLVMDEIFINYLAANPGAGGDVRTLNIPALRNMDCTPSCSWTRVVRNTLNVPSSWSAAGVAGDIQIEVSPSIFSFDGDTSHTQRITITATPVGDQTAAIVFGEVILTESGGLSPDQHLTVAVRGEGDPSTPPPSGPVADISPASFEFEVAAGDGDADILNIGNLGDEVLEWSITTDAPVTMAGIQSHDPSLDESFDFEEFVLNSPFLVGGPESFTRTGGVATQGRVTGFSFIGDASGITPTLSWASDTCMIVEAPDGTRFAVGGLDGTLPGCGLRDWDFQGSQSQFDGTYQSFHEHVFDPTVGDEGDWNFTFINDWNSPEAGPIVWSNVTVTLHKTGAATCDDITEVDWLSVDPESGATPPASTDLVDVAVDSAGLDPGTYEAALCVATNDPNAATVAVPVTLTVSDDDPPPPSATELDDADPAIEYRRGWHRVSDPDATFGGFHRRMGSAGGVGGDAPTARLEFEGDRITYLFGTSQQGGTAEVYINGAFQGTVDYFGSAPGNSPDFGHSVTFGDLGEGPHEILIVHQSGAVYVDGFIIESDDGEGGADASAAETQTVTATSAGQLSALGTALLLEVVEVGPADEWLSVVVESSASVTVSLLDPLGTLVADGDELLAGSSAVGLDVVPVLAGPYTIEILGDLGSSGNVAISTSRTITIK